MTFKVNGKHIIIRGIVQGVGFRPRVYALAKEHLLSGWVRNISGGVEILVVGDPGKIDKFSKALQSSPPPLARIDSFVEADCDPENHPDFRIIASKDAEGDFIPVSPDIALCDDCKREMFDLANRRHQYPFINCTNCGPRFTIVRDIPYDRPKTTMASFAMCPDCQKEYDDPTDRRFHAQPTACPACGPNLSFIQNGKVLAEKNEALKMTCDFLNSGKIIAIKGLGGYLLACDANNPRAIETLREKKRRTQKPFALMAANLETIRQNCILSNDEEDLLLSPQHPIVLLEKKPGCSLPDELAPGQRTLGFMLPYTPHLELLFYNKKGNCPDVLVMTSGNLSEEPIAYRDDDAQVQLSSLSDGFLVHDRAIHTRVDDSVTRRVMERTCLIRRSRGYAPNPILLPIECRSVLATGPELKNTFCMTRDAYAFISHHIGDMQNLETLRAFETGIEHYKSLFKIKPEIIACDMHPNYMASEFARRYACEQKLQLVEVQHHHAHLAACLADNGWKSTDPVIGIIFDGTGYGTDGAIWGGEFLVGGYSGFERKFHLGYTPMPGGDAAILHPARMTLAYLFENGIEWESCLPIMKLISNEEQASVQAQLQNAINTPLTSSMGRLFDATSALLGISSFASFEGEPAILLEAQADELETGSYEWGKLESSICLKHLLTNIISDLKNNIAPSIIAARFHNSMIELVNKVCNKISNETDIHTVVLSGGVWQNMYLLKRIVPLIQKNGFSVLWHKQIPTNDGCISLGQAVIAGRFDI